MTTIHVLNPYEKNRDVGDEFVKISKKNYMASFMDDPSMII